MYLIVIAYIDYIEIVLPILYIVYKMLVVPFS